MVILAPSDEAVARAVPSTMSDADKSDLCHAHLVFGPLAAGAADLETNQGTRLPLTATGLACGPLLDGLSRVGGATVTGRVTFEHGGLTHTIIKIDTVLHALSSNCELDGAQVWEKHVRPAPRLTILGGASPEDRIEMQATLLYAESKSEVAHKPYTAVFGGGDEHHKPLRDTRAENALVPIHSRNTEGVSKKALMYDDQGRPKGNGATPVLPVPPWKPEHTAARDLARNGGYRRAEWVDESGKNPFLAIDHKAPDQQRLPADAKALALANSDRERSVATAAEKEEVRRQADVEHDGGTRDNRFCFRFSLRRAEAPGHVGEPVGEVLAFRLSTDFELANSYNALKKGDARDTRRITNPVAPKQPAAAAAAAAAGGQVSPPRAMIPMPFDAPLVVPAAPVKLTKLNPKRGKAGEKVTIFFSGGPLNPDVPPRVTFGNVDVTNFAFTNPNDFVEVYAPPLEPGTTVDVVIHAFGKESTCPKQFTYTAEKAPRVAVGGKRDRRGKPKATPADAKAAGDASVEIEVADDEDAVNGLGNISFDELADELGLGLFAELSDSELSDPTLPGPKIPKISILNPDMEVELAELDAFMAEQAVELVSPPIDAYGGFGGAHLPPIPDDGMLINLSPPDTLMSAAAAGPADLAPLDDEFGDDDEEEQTSYRSLAAPARTIVQAQSPQEIVVRLKAPPKPAATGTAQTSSAAANANASVSADNEEADAAAASARAEASALARALLCRRDPLTGWTIVHYLAALGADRELAALLTHPLCPIDAVGPHGRTALDLARMRGHRVAARMIFCARERRLRPGQGSNALGGGGPELEAPNTATGGKDNAQLTAAVAKLQRTLKWLAAVA